ncbi:MAG: transcriptional repressor [Pirellulales bacterium]|nr:transcriptional repressor [Pirellulales bacterium]
MDDLYWLFMKQTHQPAAPTLAEMTPEAALRLRESLSTAGLRYTTQRAAVFAYLEWARCHPTADEIYQAVRDEVPQISLATVYNALEALVDVNLATRLDGTNNTARYDSCREQHYHLRDTETGEIRDLSTPYDPELLDRLDPKLRKQLESEGIEVTGYRLEVLGRSRK